MKEMRKKTLGAILCLGFSGGTACAAPHVLSLPDNAAQTFDETVVGDSYDIPTGPYADGHVPSIQLEGEVSRQAWRLPTPSRTTLQILAPLRAQLEAAGYEILLDCNSAECGGFDFRFDTEVIEAPDMYVDLFDFRALSARRAGDDPAPTADDDLSGTLPEDYVSLLVSRTAGNGYLQLIHVTPGTLSRTEDSPAAEDLPDSFVNWMDGTGTGTEAPGTTEGGLEKALLLEGRAVLSDLQFETGSSALSARSYPSLTALAAFLAADPERKVVLVGHSDTKGALESNMVLSRQRAQAVADKLISDLGVHTSQISAQGIGFLAPLASNADASGREENRRVEVVLLDAGTTAPEMPE